MRAASKCGGGGGGGSVSSFQLILTNKNDLHNTYTHGSSCTQMSLFSNLFGAQQPPSDPLFAKDSPADANGGKEEPGAVDGGRKKRRRAASEGETDDKKPRKQAESQAAVQQESPSPEAALAAPPASKPLATQRPRQVALEADERLPRTVFVGNLPANVKRKSLQQLFAGCGRVESVRLRSLPLKEGGGKLPRRGAIAAGAIDADRSAHAYVVFADEGAVKAALALNMTEFKGHSLRVDQAAPKGGKGAVVFDPQRSLCAGNLAHDIEDQEIIKHFGASNLEAVRVVRDPKTGLGKGVAFVLFTSKEGAKKALEQKGAAELKGRTLRLTRVSTKRQQDSKAAWQQGTGSSVGGAGSGGKASGSGSAAGGKRKGGSGKRPAVAARKLGGGKPQQKRKSS